MSRPIAAKLEPPATPRREELPEYWQATLANLEERLDVALRRRESLLQRSKRYRRERNLERLRVQVLRTQVEDLEARIDSANATRQARPLAGKPLCLDPGLDAALAVAGFTKFARVVIREAMVQTFGPEEAVVVTLSPARIAKLVGDYPARISEEIVRLVAEQVLTKTGPGRYVLNSNYEQWLRTSTTPRAKHGPAVPERRLSAAELSYCRSSSTGTAISVFQQHADLIMDGYSKKRRQRGPAANTREPTP